MVASIFASQQPGFQTTPLRKLLLLLAGKVSPIFDPYDRSSMYQSSTGGTPVAVSGDPVGLQLDKQYMGELTAAAFIAAQPELRANGAVGIVGVATPATYNTATGAGSVTRVDGSNQSYVALSGLASSGASYLFDIENTGSTYSLIIRAGASTGTAIYTLPVGQRMTVFAPPASGSLTITAQAANPATTTFTVHSFKAVPGYHRLQATGSKRPFYTEAGALRSLLYDGTDDCLVTPAIDYTGGDSVTVCMGLRKLSDAALSMVVESSAALGSNNGTFYLNAPVSASASYGWTTKGTAAASANYTNAGVAAPDTAVLAATGKISTDSTVLRRNGVQVSAGGADQGTGNFGNFAFNYGSRNNGASLPFSGHEYWSLVTPQIDPALTTLAEQIAASKSGVTL